MTEHTKIVSINGPSIATKPSLTGSLVLAAPCAKTSVPKPASLEKAALLIPCLITSPIKPPTTASPVKASCNINLNILGTSQRFLMIISKPSDKYKTTIKGTIFPAINPIRFIPPKITNDTGVATKIPIIKFPQNNSDVKKSIGIKIDSRINWVS